MTIPRRPAPALRWSLMTRLDPLSRVKHSCRCTLPHLKRYPTQVVASHKMLPKMRRRPRGWRHKQDGRFANEVCHFRSAYSTSSPEPDRGNSAESDRRMCWNETEPMAPCRPEEPGYHGCDNGLLRRRCQWPTIALMPSQVRRPIDQSSSATKDFVLLHRDGRPTLR